MLVRAANIVSLLRLTKSLPLGEGGERSESDEGNFDGEGNFEVCCFDLCVIHEGSRNQLRSFLFPSNSPLHLLAIARLALSSLTLTIRFDTCTL